MAPDPVLAYARRQRNAMAAQAGKAGAGDPDAIHDMRVAIRRLRSTLRSFRGRWDRRQADYLRAELSWLADRLGKVRDGQVLADRLTRAVHAEPPELVLGPVAARLHGRLTADSAGGMRELTEALDGERYRRLRADLDAAVGSAPRRRSGKWVRRRARKQLDRAGSILDRALTGEPPADAELHRARRAYKRARYAAEVVGTPRDRKLAKRLRRLQDVLGEHQDAVVAGELLRDQGVRAHLAGENAFTYGLLHARQRAAGDAALNRLPKAVRRVHRPVTR